MGGRTRENAGFPTNQVKGVDWLYNPGCGGMGAGACYNPAGFSYIYWPIKVNPFSSRNNLLVLHDDNFLPYEDAGDNGMCAHSSGARFEFDVYLFYREPIGALDYTAATGKITVPVTSMLPIDLEFLGEQLPQPTHPDYERKIWVVLDMKATGKMVGGISQQTEVMQTVKLDWEGTP